MQGRAIRLLPLLCQRRGVKSFAKHLPALPPTNEWPKIFPNITRSVREVRPFMKNMKSAMDTLSAFGLDANDGNPKTVVEIYPGGLYMVLGGRCRG